VTPSDGLLLLLLDDVPVGWRLNDALTEPLDAIALLCTGPAS